MSEHIFIVIILLQTSYLLNNTLQYNSSQDYFLQAPIWDGPFKKTPISFSLHNLKLIQMDGWVDGWVVGHDGNKTNSAPN